MKTDTTTTTTTTTTTPARPGNVLPFNNRLAVVRPPAPLDVVAVKAVTHTVEWVSITATILEKHAAAFEAVAHFHPEWFSTAFSGIADKMNIDVEAGKRRGTFPPRCDTYRLDNLIWKDRRGEKLRKIQIMAERWQWDRFVSNCATLELDPRAMIRAAMAKRANGYKEHGAEMRAQNEYFERKDARDANPTPENEAALQRARLALVASMKNPTTGRP
jgi:hypothetical protein